METRQSAYAIIIAIGILASMKNRKSTFSLEQKLENEVTFFTLLVLLKNGNWKMDVYISFSILIKKSK